MIYVYAIAYGRDRHTHIHTYGNGYMFVLRVLEEEYEWSTKWRENTETDKGQPQKRDFCLAVPRRLRWMPMWIGMPSSARSK